MLLFWEQFQINKELKLGKEDPEKQQLSYGLLGD